MDQAVLALAIWLLGLGTSGEANSQWQEKRDMHLPAECVMFEDGSGHCQFEADGLEVLVFPAWPENNGEQGFELPYWRVEFDHYTR